MDGEVNRSHTDAGFFVGRTPDLVTSVSGSCIGTESTGQPSTLGEAFSCRKKDDLTWPDILCSLSRYVHALQAVDGAAGRNNADTCLGFK